ncbi:MAG: hypothetical protein M9938_05590 [Solirubrobacterales bacterium]|nr:hypothetical protein [Solirubrobacterales bacterium]
MNQFGGEDRGRMMVDIALARLPELQTASGLFRETARIEGVEDTGPVTSLLPATVALLGLFRADEAGIAQPFSTGALRTRILGDLGLPATTPGELGLALWAETRAEGMAVGEIEAHLKGQIRAGFERIPVDQHAWVLSGLAEASQLATGGDHGLLDQTAGALVARVDGRSGLVVELHHRLRGAAAPIAGQFHALHAFCQLIRAGRSSQVAEPARRLADRLLALQRDDGGWPGLVDPARGEATAWYPALTVTQVAVAPMALRAAAEAGLEGEFRSAAEAGLAWAEGRNPLGFGLIHPVENRLDRGILPRREPGSLGRGLSLAGRRIRGRLAEPDPSRLILDPAVSSDDLGWVLEAWAGR